MHFKYPTVQSAIGPLASMLLRITAVKPSLVAAMRVCSWRASAERARKLFYTTTMKGRAYKCVNKSLY